MPPIAQKQASFAKGEISDDLYGRSDTAMYQVGLRTARNIIIHPTGGASNRPGTDFIGPSKDHVYARVFNFEFKTEDQYALEFGNLYMRVIREDAHVLEASHAITNITAANPCVVTAASHGLTTGDEIYITGVVGMTRVNGNRYLVEVVSSSTFKLKNQVTGAYIDASNYAAYVSGGTEARVYTLVTPYLASELDALKIVQNVNTMTLTHKNHAIMELTRVTHANWTLTTPLFEPSISPPTNMTVSPTGAASTTERYKVTAIDTETGEESLSALNSTSKAITAATKANPCVVTAVAHGFSAGDEIYIAAIVGMTQLNGRRFNIANLTTDTFELQGEDSTSYTTYVSGGTATQTFVKITNSNATPNNTIAWNSVTGADKYSVYKEQNGLFGFIGNTNTTSFIDNNLAPALTVGPPQARNPFLFTDNYPGCASFYQQRRVFGGSTAKPDTDWFSQTGAESNFSVSDPPQASDAITQKLPSRKVNEIRHFIPGNDLLVFTSGSEWRTNSGPNSGFSATTLASKPQSEWGCSNLVPIVIGEIILFAEPSNAVVRAMSYALSIDTYTSDEVSILAKHLFRQETMVDWTYARSPDSIIYAPKSDGSMLTFTFNQKQSVTAWTHLDTDGFFERVTNLKLTASGTEDGVYVVVHRVIGGHDVRYIEKFHSRIFSNDTPQDCYFVDCGLSYDNPVTISVVTAANPCVVTATAHGFSNGDIIDIFDIVWTQTLDDDGNVVLVDQLNKNRYTVSSKTTNTFQLTDQDGNVVDGSEFVTYVSGGTARKAALTFAGFDHLEGKELAILADGNVVKGVTVENGAFTLTRRASRVHAGLGYISDLETLDIEPQNGTAEGDYKAISEVAVRFKQSRSILIGRDSEHLEPMKWREDENMGAPTDLKTEVKVININSDWNLEGRIFIRQMNPLPMTILAITPDVNYNG